METKTLKQIRRLLLTEYENLIKSISRNRKASEEIQIVHTEDEADLAAISHDRELFYNLHAGDYAPLKSIEQAFKAMERGAIW